MNIYYVILIIVPFICEYLYEKTAKKVFRYFGFAVLVIFTAFRVNVGADLNNYKSYFDNIQDSANKNIMDIGFYYLNYIINTVGLPFNCLLFLIGIFNVAVLYKMIDFYLVSNKHLAILLYLGIFEIFVYSLSAIRHSIALSFSFLAIMAFMKKKHFWTIIWIVLGILFHWSMLVWIVFFVFMIVKKSIKFYTLIAITITAPFLYRFIMNTGLLSVFSSYKYNLELYFDIYGNKNGSYSMMLVYMIIALAWIYLSIAMKNYSSGVVSIKSSVIASDVELDILEWSLIVFLISKSCLALVYNSALPRLQMYFYFLLPFTVTKKYNDILKQNSLIQLILIAFVIYSFNQSIIEYSYFYGDAQLGLI